MTLRGNAIRDTPYIPIEVIEKATQSLELSIKTRIKIDVRPLRKKWF
jgi:hypothetical protein